jgi:hypothetical protein
MNRGTRETRGLRCLHHCDRGRRRRHRRYRGSTRVRPPQRTPAARLAASPLPKPNLTRRAALAASGASRQVTTRTTGSMDAAAVRSAGRRGPRSTSGSCFTAAAVSTVTLEGRERFRAGQGSRRLPELRDAGRVRDQRSGRGVARGDEEAVSELREGPSARRRGHLDDRRDGELSALARYGLPRRESLAREMEGRLSVRPSHL